MVGSLLDYLVSISKRIIQNLKKQETQLYLATLILLFQFVFKYFIVNLRCAVL